MELDSASLIVEAALLTSPQALSLKQMQSLFEPPLDTLQLHEILTRLGQFWEKRQLRLVQLEQGWRFQSAPAFAPFLARMNEEKPPRYSRAFMETLAIMAYRQPVTRGDIEEIRGVAVNPNLIRQMEERGWIEKVGRRETPGHPELFATTAQFLADLGLKSLSQLPVLAGEQTTSEEFDLALVHDAQR